MKKKVRTFVRTAAFVVGADYFLKVTMPNLLEKAVSKLPSNKGV